MVSSWLRGPAVVDRRTMLSFCLGILGLGRRGAPHLAPAGPKYRRLSEPVILPLEDPHVSWRPVWFDALAPAQDPTAGAGPNVLVKGILLGLPGSTDAIRLGAFCLTCPHERCPVSYVEDTDWVRLDPLPKPEHPLLVCPCHFSVFNPTSDGTRLVGPAPRGLYRFRFRVQQDVVAITDVEEDALR